MRTLGEDNDPFKQLRGQQRQLTSLSRRPPGNSEKELEVLVSDPGLDLAVGDGQAYLLVPESLNGLSLQSAHAGVVTVSSSGLPTVQIRNVTAGVDMLSTRITIDVSEHSSYFATTAHVVNPSNAVVSKGDILAVDVDVAGTGTKGLIVVLVFK